MDAHFQNDRLMQVRELVKDTDREVHISKTTKTSGPGENDLHNGGLKELAMGPKQPKKKCCAIVIGVVIFLVLAGATGVLVFVFTRVKRDYTILADDHLPEVNTTVGVVKGRVAQAPQGTKVNEYLGVPFARPPVGDLRYSDPVPLNRLPIDPYDATDYKYSCIQYLDMTFGSFAGSAMWNAPNQLREDCLYMNIWTPRTDGKKAVMVWIYGGGFYSGSNALWVYDGKALASHGDVIVVAPNYRVGTFGFLSTGDGKIKGNFGLLDQVVALEWVKDNIAAFGGDPDRVTLFGESSGASSAGLHLMSARSQPLFRRTIFESGSPDSHWSFMTSAQARNRSSTFLHGVNCSRDDDDAGAMLRCLRALPVDVIQQEEWVDSHFMVFPWAPTVDGRFLKDTPYNMLKAGNFQRKDSLLGVNRDEGTYWILYVLAGFTKDGPSLQNQTSFRQGIDVMAWDLSEETRARLRELYEPANDTDRPGFRDALGDFCGDRSFTCPTWQMASMLADTGVQAYFYYLAYRTSTEVWPPWMGVIHGAEIQWVFGMALNSSRGYTRGEQEFARTFMSYWANFAKTGNPNGDDLPEWPTFTREKSRYMEMNGVDDFKVKTTLRTKYCKEWAEIGRKINMQIPVK